MSEKKSLVDAASPRESGNDLYAKMEAKRKKIKELRKIIREKKDSLALE